MARILIIGATGQQGGAVLAALSGRGHDLSALVRDPSSAKASALPSMPGHSGPSISTFRLSMPSAMQQARKCSTVCTSTPP